MTTVDNARKGELRELLALFPGTRAAEEGGTVFYRIPDLALPAGCTPAKVDALLCPTDRDGYPSRLFFSSPISSRQQRNWTVAGLRILNENWFGISWRVNPSLRLAQMVAAHLKAFE